MECPRCKSTECICDCCGYCEHCCDMRQVCSESRDDDDDDDEDDDDDDGDFWFV